MGISCKWLTDIEEFRAISGEWDELVASSEEDNPFLFSDFIIIWWKYYFQDLRLRIFIVYDDFKIIGGLPLCLNRSGRLEYIGGINANYTQVLSDGNKSIIWEKLFESLAVCHDWRILQLKRYNYDSLNPGEYRLVDEAKRRGILLDICGEECSYLVKLEGEEEFKDYFNRLPKKLRYYVKRSMGEFAKLGNILLEPLVDSDIVDKASDQFIKFSRAAFRRRKECSNFEDAVYCRFFKELMLRFNAAGRLDANMLRLNDSPIALHFGFSTGKNLNYIFTTFDIALADLNPGHLLIYKLIELGARRKNKFFDMYNGYAFYKEQWSDHRQKVVFVEMRPDSVIGRIERKLTKIARSCSMAEYIKEIIRPFPALRQTARNVKKYIQKFI